MVAAAMCVLVVLTAAAGQCTRKARSPGSRRPSPADSQTAQEAQTLNLTAYAELLRSDVRTQKVAIITEVMGFTEAEDKAFWPLYREYDLEMSKLGDERVAVDCGLRAQLRQPDRCDRRRRWPPRRSTWRLGAMRVKAKYYERIKTALSPRTALRFLQVEQQLLLIIDLQISAALPMRPSERGDRSKERSNVADRMRWIAAVLVAAAGVSLSADRVRLRSGKVVAGIFIGGDSKSVRVLLDNGQVSEIPLEQAVAVEFSARKPAAATGAEAQPKPAAAAPAPPRRRSRDCPGRHGVNVRLTQAIDVDALEGRHDVQGDCGRSGDDRRFDRDPSRRVRRRCRPPRSSSPAR